MTCFGPSSTHFVSTLRKVGSEKASNKPVRRKSWQLSLTSRVPLRLTVRVSGSGINPSYTKNVHNSRLQYTLSPVLRTTHVSIVPLTLPVVFVLQPLSFLRGCSSCRAIAPRLRSFHRLDKLLKQIIGIVRARAGFRVVLHRE